MALHQTLHTVGGRIPPPCLHTQVVMQTSSQILMVARQSCPLLTHLSSSGSCLMGNGPSGVVGRRRCVRRSPDRTVLKCRAMVNVEVSSPSLVLGIALIMSGVSLFAVRKSNQKISRDSDVIVSSLIIVTGGALIFQGWRLDPLMLLCQLMTCGVACTFAYETFKLREQEEKQEQRIPFENMRFREKAPERLDEDEEDFFYDYGDVDPEGISAGLPQPRSTMNEYLAEPEEEGGWTVIGGPDPSWDEPSFSSQPRQRKPKKPNSKSSQDTPVGQTIEDWD